MVSASRQTRQDLFASFVKAALPAQISEGEEVKVSPSQTTSCNPPFRQSIEDFLDVLCNHPLTESPCSICGAWMVTVDTTFCLLGGAKAWNIPLPLCPQCDLNGGSSISQRTKALLTQ